MLTGISSKAEVHALGFFSSMANAQRIFVLSLVLKETKGGEEQALDQSDSCKLHGLSQGCDLGHMSALET